MIDDPFEMYRRMPSHQERLAKEKQVNVYFIPGTNASGGQQYAYAVCSAMAHDLFVKGLRDGGIPDFAVVIATGDGEPSEEVKDRMEKLYGFRHDEAESA